MSKITTYTKVSRVDNNDVFIVDGAKGTRIINANDASVELAGLVSSVNHRNIYRGKNLGTSVTDAQKKAIQNGTFDDLFIGDYWVIDNIQYDIADMDYWYNCGDTTFINHHLIIVPATNVITNVAMNSTRTTDGGYVSSEMYTTNMLPAKEQIKTDFRDMVLTHKEYLINAVTDGHPSGGAWFNSDIELMSEVMLYGCYIHAAIGNTGSHTDDAYTINKQQLALFRLNPKKINNRQSYWLRDIVSETNFACVHSYGDAYATNASSTWLGVRPVFAIGC